MLLILVTTAVNPKLPVVPTTSYVTTVPSTVHEHQSTTTTSSVTPTPTKEITVTKHSGTAGKEEFLLLIINVEGKYIVELRSLGFNIWT